MICPDYLCRTCTLCIVYSKSTLFDLMSFKVYIASTSALPFKSVSMVAFAGLGFEWTIVAWCDEDLDFFLRSFSFENRIDL